MRCGIDWGLTENLDNLCLFMQAKLDDVQHEAIKEGLKINAPKTQEIRIKRRNSTPLLLASEAKERMQRFIYFGSVVISETEDITSRIAKPRATFAQLWPIWQSIKLTRRVKIKIFHSNLKAMLLYGC